MRDIETRLVRIEDKIDATQDTLAKQTAILAAQHESLKDHIRRTEILEDAIIPLKKHDAMLLGAAKLILFGISILGALEGIVVLLTYLKH